MTQSMNYINALPDFLAMQRVSFCWFINQGLTEELTLFSKIYDFSQNTEYIMFADGSSDPTTDGTSDGTTDGSVVGTSLGTLVG